MTVDNEGDGASAHTTSHKSDRMTGRIEIVGRVSGRRTWTPHQKLEILHDAFGPGGSVREAIELHEVSSGLLYTWRRHLLEGSLGVPRQPQAKFARVEVMAVPADPAPALPPVAPAAAAPSGPMNGMIEIALPGGVSVRVDAQVDSGALRRVLAALTRR